jgi:hypothetical protein
MKTCIAGIAAIALLAGASGAAYAQDTTTVIHKDDGGDRSKTVIKRDDGSKTVIKKHGAMTKKVHTSPDGDKTIVKKTTEQ